MLLFNYYFVATIVFPSDLFSDKSSDQGSISMLRTSWIPSKNVPTAGIIDGTQLLP
jgi:hypothetical protein